MTRARLRDLGFTIGMLPPGPLNAITDVDGVAVGHHTVIRDEPRIARTGVTVVHTRTGEGATDLCYGGISSFNGNGEMTGHHWLDESGLLAGPIGITNTHQVGLVRDALVDYEISVDPSGDWWLPVVGETYDGFLNDIEATQLTRDDVFSALAASSTGAVGEGNVGGGTGMICHEFKGGIGTASRLVRGSQGPDDDDPHGDTGLPVYTVGALVQANYGARHDLRLDGRHVGEALDAAAVPLPTDPGIAEAGSIIVIIATDAPLLADQCKRLARRATVGLARVGGIGSNGSGDIFLAFSTANRISPRATEPFPVVTMPASRMTALFRATIEAVEEAIWNALCQAETMTGHRGRTVYAIPLDRLAALR